jgi:hypothetical protein
MIKKLIARGPDFSVTWVDVIFISVLMALNVTSYFMPKVTISPGWIALLVAFALYLAYRYARLVHIVTVLRRVPPAH